jgi:hypothetical protein
MTIDTRPLKKAKRRRAANLSRTERAKRAERELAKICGIPWKEYTKGKAELLKLRRRSFFLKAAGTAKPKRKAERRGLVRARAKGAGNRKKIATGKGARAD